VNSFNAQDDAAEPARSMLTGEPETTAPAGPADQPAEAAATEAAAAEAEAEAQAMRELLEQYGALAEAAPDGEFVEGRVVAFTDLGVVVDIGGKAEALIPAQEFTALEGSTLPFGPGDRVEVQPLGQEKDGYQLVSYLRAYRRRLWDSLEQAYRSHRPLQGTIVERIKGGLVVDIGIRAFLPTSQIDLRQTPEPEKWVGQQIECLILKMNRKRGNVVVSRRALLEQELQARRQKLLETLTEGAIVRGTVKSITDYGVFVDLGGLDGMIHVTDLSWSRVRNPATVVSVGQEIEAKVLKFDRERGRISLGVKQLQPDPWEHVPERYPPGSRVHGTVVSITDYGAFVELEPGVEGLVHVSQMSWSRRLRHPSKLVSVGDLIEVVVLEVKPEERRIALSFKQTRPDPWETVPQKYPVGSIVTGRVRNLTEFGVFVELEDGVDGLIHASDLSWTERVQPAERFKKGDLVEARVLKIDTEQRRLSLGIKQLNDIWQAWFAAHRVGEIVTGRVARLSPFGAFVELEPGIEGLCHISEVDLGHGPDREKQLAAVLEPGRQYEFKILRLDPEQRRIGLSHRAAVRQAERRALEAHRSSESSPRATIADAILAKRGSL